MGSDYEKLMELSDKMCLIAIAYYKLKRYEEAERYKNASIGYKEKALKLKNVR